MYESSLELDKLLKLLEEQPQRIAKFTAGLNAAQLHTPPAIGEWSINEVLAHLRSCSDIWGKYIGIILEQDMPTFKAMNPRTWIKQTDYPQQGFHASFAAYQKQRSELLTILHTLSPEQWERSATVTGAGKPIVRTVYTYTEWIAVHERSHMNQIQKTANAVKGE